MRPGILLLLVVASLALGSPRPLRAQEANPDRWELIAPGSFGALFAPLSGAFLANTARGPLRSDDGGRTWAALALPPELAATPEAASLAAVNPADHRIAYVRAEAGLFRSADDGVTWARIAEAPDRVAVTGGDPNLIYLGSTVYRVGITVARSRDGGANWERIEPPVFGANRTSGPGCHWNLPQLTAHPSNPNLVFFAGGCYTTKDFGTDLLSSAHQGASWSTARSSPYDFPNRLVGGLGVAPSRLYLSTAHPQGPGGSLYRSDDDGLTWTGAGTFPRFGISAVAVDPTNPDRVFLDDGTPEGVKVTTDGGATWAALGKPAAGIAALAVGVDGQTVYLANKDGLYRLRP